ncbi:MAG: hypothetical protein HQK77_06275 [Desulfobacterales bacterium]|nr:hypothetical protein [Desulfobacterales bacterium]
MSRKCDQDFSSFDLLLDTICNTFGGIVFISLLMVILAQSESNESQKTIKESTESINQSIASLNNQINQLNEKIKGKKEQMRQNEPNSIVTLKNQIEQLNQKIEDSKKKNQRQLRFPRLKAVSDKNSIVIAIQSSKLYIIQDVYSQSYVNRGFDKSDVEVSVSSLDKRHMFSIKLLPNRGQLISEGSLISGKLKDALHHLNPDHEYILFCVSKNSFTEFNYVKKMFIERGFEYNWIIISDVDDTIQLSSGGGSASVQ